jgi:hypothetical protein
MLIRVTTDLGLRVNARLIRGVSMLEVEGTAIEQPDILVGDFS